MPVQPVKMTRHYNKHWSRPATRTYEYNHTYMSTYYKPMTHFLNKEMTYRQREGTPGAYSFAERIHKFPVYGGMFPDHEAAGRATKISLRSSSLPPPAARRHRDETPVRGGASVRGSSLAPGGFDTSSIRAEASSARGEMQSSKVVESSQRQSRMESSSSVSRTSRRSRAETTEEKKMTQAEKAVAQMREYLKNQQGDDDKYVPLWKKHPYYLPVESIVVPPHEGSIWPEGRRHFDLVSSYDCMIDFLGIKKPE